MPRRFRRRAGVPWLFILALAILVGLRWAWYLAWPAPREPEPLAEGMYCVVRVVDGDTIIVAPLGGDAGQPPMADSAAPTARVRLLGIDTPESVKPDHPVELWALEAAEFARQRLAGQQVRLAFDKRRTDIHGRLLAYVYLGEVHFNEELVRQGLARVSFLAGDSPTQKRLLLAAQDEARTARRGLWGVSP